MPIDVFKVHEDLIAQFFLIALSDSVRNSTELCSAHVAIDQS